MLTGEELQPCFHTEDSSVKRCFYQQAYPHLVAVYELLQINTLKLIVESIPELAFETAAVKPYEAVKGPVNVNDKDILQKQNIREIVETFGVSE